MVNDWNAVIFIAVDTSDHKDSRPFRVTSPDVNQWFSIN
jgi:hypothetical protein